MGLLKKRLIILALLLPVVAFAAGETTSPNMSLTIPGVGVTSGPQWASDLNNSLTVIDAHDHSPGNGVQVTPAGLNINSDLSFNNTNISLPRSVRFTSQGTTLSGSNDISSSYVTNGDLYFNDGNGNHVRITQGGSVTGSAGTITGLPSGTASAAFSSGQGTFIFQQATSTGANMDSATLIIRYPGSYPTPAGDYIAIEAPSSLSTGYAFTLPAAPPSAPAALIMDTAGTVTASAGAFTPTGMIAAFGGTSAPAGWLLCNGASILQSGGTSCGGGSCAALFAVIGTAYGSADGTHFNIPDLRGQFLRGVTGASANDPDASSRTAMNIGGNTGNNVGSVQSGATAVNGLHDTGHIHPGSIFDTVMNGGTNPGTLGPSIFGGASGGSLTGQAIANLAGDSETRPINAYVNYIIKY